jgi:2-amino-4-hydroxy-6-hydroxymethyldihydropteridine diphosphokinase
MSRGADDRDGKRPAAAYIALGSNVGDPAAQVRAAFGELGALPRTSLRDHSSLYRSAPVGYLDQPDFINAVARLETMLDPRALLDAVLAIEHRHGRERTFPNAPRTLDLDIILYGDLTVQGPGLTIPHPRMHERAFVLVPLAEIAPGCVVPGRGALSDLLKKIDAGTVVRLTGEGD